MTPEEYARKHCKNGHDPMQCEKLKDLMELINNVRKEERKRCAELVEHGMNFCCTVPYDDYHGNCHVNAGKVIRSLV